MDGAPRPPVRLVAPLIAGVLVLAVLGVRGHLRRVEVERSAGEVASDLRRVEVERSAGEVASAIAGHQVRVHCPGPIKRHLLYEITEGRVRFSAEGVPDPETNLSGDACAGLRRVLDRGATLNLQCLFWRCSADDTRAAMALAVLTHESVHMRGVMDEGATECEAGTRVATTALALGLTPQSAAAVAHWQRTDYAELLPEQYRACADSNAA